MILLRHTGHFFGAVGYAVAVIVLFQFVCIRFVLGYYQNPMSQSLALANLLAQETIPRTNVQATIGLPVRLRIPRIRVNAVIRSVGLLPNGSMGVPKLPSETAWYMLGPKPGETGSAVIAGHVNWWYGAIGVFQNIKNLKKGDVITVQDDKGATTTFVVRETRAYGQNDNASDVFRSYDGRSHLNLVTCSGVWNTVSKTYSKRLVVFTDEVKK